MQPPRTSPGPLPGLQSRISNPQSIQVDPNTGKVLLGGIGALDLFDPTTSTFSLSLSLSLSLSPSSIHKKERKKSIVDDDWIGMQRADTVSNVFGTYSSPSSGFTDGPLTVATARSISGIAAHPNNLAYYFLDYDRFGTMTGGVSLRVLRLNNPGSSSITNPA